MEKGFYVELKWVKMCHFYNCDIFQLRFATLTNMEVIDLGFEVSATWFICDLGVEVRIREEYWSFLVKSQSMAQTHCRVGWRTNTHLPVTAVYYGLTAPMLQQPCVQYIHFHWGAIIGCFPLLRHKLCIAESFTRFDINQDPLNFFLSGWGPENSTMFGFTNDQCYCIWYKFRAGSSCVVSHFKSSANA